MPKPSRIGDRDAGVAHALDALGAGRVKQRARAGHARRRLQHRVKRRAARRLDVFLHQRQRQKRRRRRRRLERETTRIARTADHHDRVGAGDVVRRRLAIGHHQARHPAVEPGARLAERLGGIAAERARHRGADIGTIKKGIARRPTAFDHVDAMVHIEIEQLDAARRDRRAGSRRRDVGPSVSTRAPVALNPVEASEAPVVRLNRGARERAAPGE